MSNAFLKVRHNLNEISIYGDLKPSTMSSLTAHVHQCIDKAGYRDICLNFANLSSLNPSVVAPLAAIFRYWEQEYKVDFELVEPNNIICRDKMRQWGLAYNIDTNRYKKPKTNSSEPIVLRFRDHDEREAAVDKVVNSALRKANLTRQNVAALDWAANEITDNVLTHAKSKVGGFLICSKIPHKNILEFTVADCGVGISNTLGIPDEGEAVERAVQEGVTRNRTTNQGNGLYGTYRLALASAGIFVLKSRHGNLYVTRNGETHVARDRVPFRGTFVVCQVDCDRPDLIDRAFVFGGRAHVPAFDYLERNHEGELQYQTKVKALDICKTFGSRQSGEEARNYIKNLLSCSPQNEIFIDFEGVNVVSSSFADEVFGKLFVELGPMQFMRTIKLKNTVSAVEGLIDRAIRLRSQTGI